MILIFSKTEEASTDCTIQWLLKWDKAFIRLNREETALEIDYQLNDEQFKIVLRNEKCELDLDEITCSWHRRGNYPLSKPHTRLKMPPAFERKMRQLAHGENLKLKKHLHGLLAEKPSINNYLSATVNKLDILKKAKEIGLKIPKTLITSNKNTLVNFLSEHNKVISKPIYEAPLYGVEGFLVKYLNKLFTLEDITDLPDSFSPSLFQVYIPKRYELRIFYLNGKFYSMAILSQESEQTSIDFRDYNRKNPNRNVPFKLPYKLQDQLDQLMKAKELNCGSIDMIVSEDKQFYFLEVNAVGQFGMTSKPCNYYLHKLVAQTLSDAKES